VSCTRSWQAEAVHDGRLSGADRAAFERHAASCSDCAREARELEALAEVARALPTPESEPLARLRRRNVLLQLANERAVRSAPRVSARRSVALLASVAVAALLTLFLVRRPGAVAPPDLVPGVPTYRISAAREAEWRVVEHGTTLRLGMQRGRFELSVDKLQRGQRFLLDLPDGELEVRGTRFVVEVDRTRSLSVHVSEGLVAVRLRGRGEVMLGAGEHWKAPLDPEQPAVVSPAASASPATVLHSAAPAAKESAPVKASAGTAFADAMAAFSAGDYGRAEALFVAFERAHPGDARVEDVLFLRAVARARRGDLGGARTLARVYLERYPSGLRRKEAERIGE
jgi:hypothetical protein